MTAIGIIFMMFFIAAINVISKYATNDILIWLILLKFVLAGLLYTLAAAIAFYVWGDEEA